MQKKTQRSAEDCSQLPEGEYKSELKFLNFEVLIAYNVSLIVVAGFNRSPENISKKPLGEFSIILNEDQSFATSICPQSLIEDARYEHNSALETCSMSGSEA